MTGYKEELKRRGRNGNNINIVLMYEILKKVEAYKKRQAPRTVLVNILCSSLTVSVKGIIKTSAWEHGCQTAED